MPLVKSPPRDPYRSTRATFAPLRAAAIAAAKPAGLGVPSPEEAFTPVDQLGLPLIGIPFAASSEKMNCIMLSEAAVKNLSVSALEKIFKKGCMIDGYAAAALQERGLNHLIGGISVQKLKHSSSEYYTDDPLNNDLWAEFHAPLFNTRFVFEVPETLKTRTLGIYRDSKEQALGVASLIFEQPDGARCALLGYEGFHVHYISSARVCFLNRVADWVSGNTFPIRSSEPVQCMFVPRVTDDGILRSSVILNPTIGWQKPFEVILRNVPAGVDSAEWCVPSESPVKISVIRSGNECRVTIPMIAPWGIGWLKIPAE